MIGSLCFISDDYFERFARDSLMRNHTREDGLGGRPYLIVFEDRRVPEVMWAVPLSSRYDKYAAIRQHKIERFGKCETIHLVGDMAGQRRFDPEHDSDNRRCHPVFLDWAPRRSYKDGLKGRGRGDQACQADAQARAA